MARFQVGDKVYVNALYGVASRDDHWNNRPGVVIGFSEAIVDGQEPIAYYVDLPAWNGLAEFKQAIFRSRELDGELDRG
jgi:hypothetical protein